MKEALRGVRVIDCGRYIAGPFCGSLLAECGAEVIRVEPIEGSPDRYVTPIATDGSGVFHMHVNRFKRSVALDQHSPTGKEVLRKLISTADVVIANLPMAELKKLGLDTDSVKAINDRAILVTTSAFGNKGPYKDSLGFDGVAQAMSGLMYLSGPLGYPSKAMFPFVDFMTAITNAFGVMVALKQRDKSGKPTTVSTSLMKSAMTVASAALAEQSSLKKNRQSTWNRSPIAAPSDLFRTSDGWIMIQIIGDKMFRRWTKLINQEELLLSDQRFKTDLLRGDHGAYLSEIMTTWLADKSTNTALALLAKYKIPAGPVHSVQQALDDKGLISAGFFTPNDYPGVPDGSMLVTSLLTARKDSEGRAPRLGEHSVEILKELGYSSVETKALLQTKTVFQASKAHPAN